MSGTVLLPRQGKVHAHGILPGKTLDHRSLASRYLRRCRPSASVNSRPAAKVSQCREVIGTDGDAGPTSWSSSDLDASLGGNVAALVVP